MHWMKADRSPVHPSNSDDGCFYQLLLCTFIKAVCFPLAVRHLTGAIALKIIFLAGGKFCCTGCLIPVPVSIEQHQNSLYLDNSLQ